MEYLMVSRHLLALSEQDQDLAYLIGASGHLIRFEPVRFPDRSNAKDWCYLADIRKVAPDKDSIRIGFIPMREVPDAWDRQDLDVLVVHGSVYGPVHDGKRPVPEGTGPVGAPDSFADLGGQS